MTLMEQTHREAEQTLPRRRCEFQKTWPGIVSRFQLVILAGRRSKQLYNGAQSRIPADPLKKRNTSIALEELRRGLIPFGRENGTPPQTVFAANDTTVNTAIVKPGPDFDLLKAAYVNERT